MPGASCSLGPVQSSSGLGVGEDREQPVDPSSYCSAQFRGMSLVRGTGACRDAPVFRGERVRNGGETGVKEEPRRIRKKHGYWISVECRDRGVAIS